MVTCSFIVLDIRESRLLKRNNLSIARQQNTISRRYNFRLTERSRCIPRSSNVAVSASQLCCRRRSVRENIVRRYSNCSELGSRWKIRKTRIRIWIYRYYLLFRLTHVALVLQTRRFIQSGIVRKCHGWGRAKLEGIIERLNNTPAI